MEHQDEQVGGDYTTEWRMYDSRLGRFLSIDPIYKSYPSLSSYTAFNDNPIFFMDPNGASAQGTGDVPPKKQINVYITNTHRKKIKDGTVDKALESSYRSAKEVEANNANNETEFYVLEVKNLKDAAKQIKALKAAHNAEINTLYIDSHGSAKENSFKIGDEWILERNIGSRSSSALKLIGDELVAGKTNVVLFACCSAANAPGKTGEEGRGDVFIQKVANRLNANVYGNRSFSPGGDIFGNMFYSPTMTTSASKDPVEYPCTDCFAQPGYWATASPTPVGNGDITTKTINALHLNSNGTFGISTSIW